MRSEAGRLDLLLHPALRMRAKRALHRGLEGNEEEGQHLRRVRRITALLAAIIMALAMMTLSAGADDHFPEHGHMLVQRPEIGVVTIEDVDYIAAVGFRRCVDLAAGQALHNGAHHDRVHFGTAGEMLDTKAGHAVVPTAPLSPYDDCAALEAALPIIFGPA
jgi:hypothetical protein